MQPLPKVLLAHARFNACEQPKIPGIVRITSPRPLPADNRNDFDHFAVNMPSRKRGDRSALELEAAAHGERTAITGSGVAG